MHVVPTRACTPHRPCTERGPRSDSATVVSCGAGGQELPLVLTPAWARGQGYAAAVDSAWRHLLLRRQSSTAAAGSQLLSDNQREELPVNAPFPPIEAYRLRNSTLLLLLLAACSDQDLMQHVAVLCPLSSPAANPAAAACSSCCQSPGPPACCCCPLTPDSRTSALLSAPQ